MDDGKIFKIDTVPPPPGEGDAYSAPTRVGALNAEEWEALMAAHEGRTPSSPATQAARGEPVPASEGGPRSEPEPAARAEVSPRPAEVIPAPAPLPAFSVPSVADDDDDADDVDLAWPDVGEAALSAVDQPRPTALASTPPPPRPSAFPEWVAGTNVLEKAALEAARRRKIRRRVTVAVVVSLALAIAAAVATLIRH